MSAQGSVICDASSMSAMSKSTFLKIPKPAPTELNMRRNYISQQKRSFSPAQVVKTILAAATRC